MSHLWSPEDRALLDAEIADTHDQLADLVAVEPVTPEAGVQRDDTVLRTRRELARLEAMQAEANHG